MLFKFTSLVTVLTLAVMTLAAPSNLEARQDVVCISGNTCSCAALGLPTVGVYMTFFCGGSGDPGCK
ncbi:hypothetical protein B0H11DRAFT_2268796 [Mycena galericulata]|nr:hypothetical protein B0H11DRAFT_2270787 [Mycena galericulata]KAJ7511798.1 hypothetical protein B0H11DRAFT_2268796 [Mycena galericulata]